MTAGFVLFSITAASAQVSLGSSGYQQNFNDAGGVAVTSSEGTRPLTWQNNSTYAGWFAVSGGSTAGNYAGSNGNTLPTGTTVGIFKSSTVDNEGALGVARTSGDTATSKLGVWLKNDTGGTITSLTISYTGEQWRQGTGDPANRLDVRYSLDATSLTSGTWVNVNALDFTGLHSGTSAALDGNSASNQSAQSHTITGLSIAAEATFWLSWTDWKSDTRTGRTNASLAIDDLSVTATYTIAEKLRYAPPTLVDPTTVNVLATGTDTQTITLGDTEDAIIQFPSTVVQHPVVVSGGRRVVVIGGEINYDGSYSRALAFKRMPAGSIVFIEGMKIDTADASGADAINIDGKTRESPDVYIQNCRISGVHGTSSGHHGDAIQFTGAVGSEIYGRGNLYVGHSDFDTSYQSIICAKHVYHDMSYTFVNRVESCYFTYNTLSNDNRCAYIYWTSSGSDTTKCNYLDLIDVWMNEWSARGLTVKDDHLYPGPTYNVDQDTYVISSHSYVSGSVDKGIPPGGSCLIGSVSPGAGYVNTSGYKQVVGNYSYQGEVSYHSHSGGSYGNVAASGASEGSHLLYSSGSVGDWIKLHLVPVPKGSLTVTLRYLAGPDRGIAQLNLGGVLSTIDMYSATSAWKTHTHATINFSAGHKYPVFTITGKNAASSGYTLSVDEVNFSN